METVAGAWMSSIRKSFVDKADGIFGMDNALFTHFYVSKIVTIVFIIGYALEAGGTENLQRLSRKSLNDNSLTINLRWMQRLGS